MDFMRRYGGYIFVVPFAIFWLDDYLTDWHDHGHEKTLYIVLENIGEDLASLLFYLAVRAWENRPLPHMHAECPQCHFKWVMHPRQRMLQCPHCGAPEPS
jgi:DNA-directed RNA polymerase subunit RPC12/RpoP